MATDGLFAIPIYHGIINNPQMQKKFEDIHAKLFSENKLKYKPEWNNTQKLSSLDFHDNIIEENNLFEFRNELMLHLSQYLKDIGREPGTEQVKIVASWMTSNSKGDYSHQHCHGASDIAGVYYVKAAPGDARFYFRSSNKGASGSYVFNSIPDIQYFTPEVGKIILFPGWLEHGVEKQMEDRERVSVSFNLEFIRRHLI